MAGQSYPNLPGRRFSKEHKRQIVQERLQWGICQVQQGNSQTAAGTGKQCGKYAWFINALFLGGHFFLKMAFNVFNIIINVGFRIS